MQNQPINIDLKDAEQVNCECGNKFFDQSFVVFRIPAIISPSGQDLIIQQAILKCLECKKILPLTENRKGFM